MAATPMDLPPLPPPVLAQLEAILDQDAQADRVALVWPEPIEPAESLRQVAETPLRFVYCPSELAMRERLVHHEPGRERLVMLSPFDETRLAKDVLARLWRQEPKRISPWRTLEQLLHVRQIDPRLTAKGYRWIAECLVSSYDRYRGKIPFGEVLDFDKAWRALALGLLDYTAETVDLDGLLEWSRGAGAGAAVADLPEALSEHLGDWLEPRLGAQARTVQSLWQAGNAGDMLAIGLVCGLLYGDGVKATQEVFQARGRLSERFFGGARIDGDQLREFGAAAVGHAQRQLRVRPYGEFSGSFAQAEQILASLDLLPLAAESDLLPMAFGQQLERFAGTLKRKSLPALLRALAALQQHQLARVRSDQVRRAELAVRTARWLQTPEPETQNAQAAIADYIDNGGYLDWARSGIWSGDEHEGVTRAYERLSKQSGERRERLNQRFAEHLDAVARGDRSGSGILPVESALDELVAPLAKAQPVLLLVIDGMSQAVYRELATDLLRHSWVELQHEGASGPGCLLAALPSVTRISRYSLLAGCLGEGGNGDEKRAFAAYPALKKLASTKFPPLLFHKADLQQPGSGALAARVREVIAEQQHRIVGAVINAVDDHLSSGAQLSVSWSVESISLLRQILEAARDSGRLVIFTSDHGHVLDHDMRYTKTDGDAERYKPVTEPVLDGEVRVKGRRVMQPGNEVILPWSEKLRYTPKKMGYHGGGSPQELIIPVGVYRNAGETDPVPGWREVPRQTPAWWRLETSEDLVAEPAPKARSKPVKKPEPAPTTGDLFAQGEGAETPAAEKADWLGGLFGSPVYRQMRSRAGRAPVDETQLRRLLILLGDGGGQQMVGALVQALGLPAIRMNGFRAGAQKLLNVDGYPVLSIDRAAKTVKLNIESLRTQFEL